MAIESVVVLLFEENLADFTLQIRESFTVAQSMVLEYFISLQFTEIEIFQIALSMSFVEDVDFTDLNNIDVKLLYFERSLEHKFLQAISSAELVFSTKLTSILVEQGLTISTEIQESLNVEFAKIWTGQEITFEFFTKIIEIAQATELQGAILESIFAISDEIFLEISVFQTIMMKFGETLGDFTGIFNLAILTSTDLEQKLEKMTVVEFLTEISKNLEIDISFDAAVILDFVIRIAFIDKFIITEDFFMELEKLDVFSLTIEDISFDLLVTLAETTSYSELVLRDAITIFKSVFKFNIFTTTILDFFRFQDLADAEIEPKMMIALQL